MRLLSRILSAHFRLPAPPPPSPPLERQRRRLQSRHSQCRLDPPCPVPPNRRPESPSSSSTSLVTYDQPRYEQRHYYRHNPPRLAHVTSQNTDGQHRHTGGI